MSAYKSKYWNQIKIISDVSSLTAVMFGRPDPFSRQQRSYNRCYRWLQRGGSKTTFMGKT